jgi:hypothetical protein
MIIQTLREEEKKKERKNRKEGKKENWRTKPIEKSVVRAKCRKTIVILKFDSY